MPQVSRRDLNSITSFSSQGCRLQQQRRRSCSAGTRRREPCAAGPRRGFRAGRRGGAPRGASSSAPGSRRRGRSVDVNSTGVAPVLVCWREDAHVGVASPIWRSQGRNESTCPNQHLVRVVTWSWQLRHTGTPYKAASVSPRSRLLQILTRRLFLGRRVRRSRAEVGQGERYHGVGQDVRQQSRAV